MKRLLAITCLILGLAACQKPPATLAPTQVMNLVLLNEADSPLAVAGAPADNYTYAVIEDTLVDILVLDTSTSLTFTTDIGTFSTGGTTCQAKFNQNGKAYAYLRSNQARQAHVQVSVGTAFSTNIAVPFQVAWPDSIYMSLPAAASDSVNTRIAFTAKLIRAYGTPTAGIQVGFYAKDDASAEVGKFLNITLSDTTGSVSAQFWPLDAGYLGFLSITAYAVVPGQDSVKGEGLLYLNVSGYP